MTRLRVNSPRRRWSEIALMLILATLVVGCSTAEQPTNSEVPSVGAAATVPPTPSPVVVSTPSDTLNSSTASSGSRETRRLDTGSLTYNGEIMAEAIVPVVAQVAGQIQEVKIEVGDSINKGDLLVRIDSTVAEAQRAQAQAALELAQSQVELATAEPKKADLDAAQAAISAARAAYDRALQGVTEEKKRMALAQLRQAEAAVSVYQGQYDRIAGNPYSAMMEESLLLQQATLARRRLRRSTTRYLRARR